MAAADVVVALERGVGAVVVAFERSDGGSGGGSGCGGGVRARGWYCGRGARAQRRRRRQQRGLSTGPVAVVAGAAVAAVATVLPALCLETSLKRVGLAETDKNSLSCILVSDLKTVTHMRGLDHTQAVLASMSRMPLRGPCGPHDQVAHTIARVQIRDGRDGTSRNKRRQKTLKDVALKKTARNREKDGSVGGPADPGGHRAGIDRARPDRHDMAIPHTSHE
eukprot:356331-Chlamydomonas_euryale.AAC.2